MMEIVGSTHEIRVLPLGSRFLARVSTLDGDHVLNASFADVDEAIGKAFLVWAKATAEARNTSRYRYTNEVDAFFYDGTNVEDLRTFLGKRVRSHIIYDVDYIALENRNVLVVEDNKINQMITKKILEKNKMQCTVADNGMDAIKLVQENNFDIVLMDIHMPGISGIEATQEIRKFNKMLPIIALTAVTIDENLDDFYRAGFNEIIPKPFKTEEFFEKIYRTLENRKIPIES